MDKAAETRCSIQNPKLKGKMGSNQRRLLEEEEEAARKQGEFSKVEGIRGA